MGSTPTSSLRVLYLDPDLAGNLSREEFAAARRGAIADEHLLPRGAWEPTLDFAGAPGMVGLLVVRGFLLREVSVGRHPAAELLGPGDLLRPWQLDDDIISVPLRSNWTALEDTRLAVLDRDFARSVERWPEIAAALVCRALARTNRMNFYMALTHLVRLEDRILGLMWALADRWGRVQPGGVLVPVKLGHAVVAKLVSARRQSISRAVARLAERAVLLRTPDRCWRLTGQPPLLAHPSPPAPA
ncbi:MAG: Crp/Fnr family transcriptional regulator [Solirubrobacteraceae bacterium MAG38_C4-C5]|nr:Crp/Fnr family transcriptional regulator [Candidatus Siliceabacter maunaloa]